MGQCKVGGRGCPGRGGLRVGGSRIGVGRSRDRGSSCPGLGWGCLRVGGSRVGVGEGVLHDDNDDADVTPSGRPDFVTLGLITKKSLNGNYQSQTDPNRQ